MNEKLYQFYFMCLVNGYLKQVPGHIETCEDWHENRRYDAFVALDEAEGLSKIGYQWASWEIMKQKEWKKAVKAYENAPLLKALK